MAFFIDRGKDQPFSVGLIVKKAESALGLLGVKLRHKLARNYHWDPDSFVCLEEQKEKY